MLCPARAGGWVSNRRPRLIEYRRRSLKGDYITDWIAEARDKFTNTFFEELNMPLATWLPAMFILGLVLMGLFGLFLRGCENI